jgi:RNA polymerase sigma-70 factor (ECF subfamily)
LVKTASLPSASDEDLMVLVRTRDYPAFVVLFDRYRARAVSFVARMTGDPDTAESIAHEVFTQAVAQAASYDPREPFVIWFFSILHRIVSESVAKRDPGPHASLERTAVLDPVSEDARSPARVDEARIAYEAVNHLKPIYREVVYFRLFERMSYEDIAAITGEKSATVRKRMNYAVEHLRKDMPH